MNATYRTWYLWLCNMRKKTLMTMINARLVFCFICCQYYFGLLTNERTVCCECVAMMWALRQHRHKKECLWTRISLRCSFTYKHGSDLLAFICCWFTPKLVTLCTHFIDLWTKVGAPYIFFPVFILLVYSCCYVSDDLMSSTSSCIYLKDSLTICLMPSDLKSWSESDNRCSMPG